MIRLAEIISSSMFCCQAKIFYPITNREFFTSVYIHSFQTHSYSRTRGLSKKKLLSTLTLCRFFPGRYKHTLSCQIYEYKSSVPIEIMSELNDYFKVHFTVLKFIGIPLEPMKNTGIYWKILYCIYSVLFVGLFPVYFALSEFLQLFNESNFDTFTFNLSYAITHCLGKLRFIF